MLTFYKKYWRTAFDIALIALTVYLIMFAFSYLYNIAAPVFLSFIIFMIIEPLAKRLHKLGIKKSIATAISVLFFTTIILGAFAAAGIVLTKEITYLIEMLPQYQQQIGEQVAAITSFLTDRYESLPPDVTENSQEIINRITTWGAGLATGFLTGLTRFLTSFSSFLINFGIGIVLAYFLSIEIKDWRRTAADKTPKTFKKAFFFLKENVFKGIGIYLKAQFKLISVTFVVILAALLILRVDNAFTIALLAAIFDLLPLLGVSTVFVPWIVYLFIVGQTGLAIWLTVLLLVVLITRQVLEPKITGDSLGVSAFTMLVFIIISLSLFGIAGLIISPVLVILLKALYTQGYLHRWIRAPINEYDEEPRPPQDGPGGPGGAAAPEAHPSPTPRTPPGSGPIPAE
ncbi:sporulation integral membrane protein YtvI [Paenibacillus sp. 1P07SE]|uniref:sporulation integral membrane protein YtvI n=1 Tax=Paenibacillus sp. 1P07SE TaxID=3132209 RepID=UPI0039A424B8